MEKGHPSIAKITRPSLPAASPRERLFRRLDAGTQYRAAWISGPAGSGKTTLVSSWLESRNLSSLWYQMDGGDADMATFFYYLGQAARQAAPRSRRPLPLLTPEYLADVPAFSRRYFEDLWGRLKPPLIIVFDNYHELPQGSPFDETLRSRLAAVPEGFRVLILSRSEPPPAFTGVLAGSKLDLVGWDDLRLTEDESAAIARQHLGDGQNGETLRWMHEKTGGWAAGLILLAKLVKRGALDLRSLNAVGSEQVFDYFANELFDKRTDEALRDFLLKTAILPRITPSAAEKLTGNREAGRILSELNRRNYFTEKRLGPELSYQYHPLFREFLQSRAETAFAPDERTRIRTAAAALLEQAGQIEDAAELYRAAGDETMLARLILSHAPALVGQGRNRTLEQWLLGLSLGARSSSPWLLYWLGICRMPFDLPESRSHLEQAFEGFRSGKDDPAGLFLSWCGVVDTFVFEWGNFTPLDRWIAIMEEVLAPGPEFPSPDIEARVASGMFSALMYRQPHHPELPAWAEKVRMLVQSGADIHLRIMAGIHLILYYTWWTGDLAKAGLLVDSLKTASSAGMPPLQWTAWHAIKAAYYWGIASYEDCIRAVEEGLQAAETTGVHLWDFMLLAQGAHGALTLGEPDKAAALLRRMERLIQLDPKRRLDVSHYYYLSASEAENSGNLPLALQDSETSLAITVESGTPFLEAIAGIGVARVLFELGEEKKAAPYLDRARRIGNAMKTHVIEYLCSLQEADFYLNGNRGEKKGLAALGRFLAAGKAAGGFVNPVRSRPEKMARLYQRALEAGIEVEHVRQLILRRNVAADPPPYHVELWPWRLRISTFGKFIIQRNGEPLAYAHKAPKKPLELLRLLIALGNTSGEARLMELLWPDADGDKAHKALNMAVARLRELLGLKEALQVSEGAVSLDERYAWTDARAFARLIEEAASAARAGREAESAQLLDKAAQLYRGPFLEGDPQSWAIGTRERFRDAFLRAVESLGAQWERKRQWRKAVEVYDRGLAVDDLIEKLYARMMECYLRLGSQAEALAVYRRLLKTLTAYGLKPSDETEETHRKIVANET